MDTRRVVVTTLVVGVFAAYVYYSGDDTPRQAVARAQNALNSGSEDHPRDGTDALALATTPKPKGYDYKAAYEQCKSTGQVECLKKIATDMNEEVVIKWFRMNHDARWTPHDLMEIALKEKDVNAEQGRWNKCHDTLMAQGEGKDTRNVPSRGVQDIWEYIASPDELKQYYTCQIDNSFLRVAAIRRDYGE